MSKRWSPEDAGRGDDVSTYEPGTVAVVTDRYGRSGRGICNTKGGWDFTTAGAALSCYSGATEIVEVRPLVVLDPENFLSRLGDVLDALRGTGSMTGGYIADQIEAQTRPPRIAEPALYGVVRARHKTDGRTDYFVRHISGGPSDEHWYGDDVGYANWRDLSDPVLVREGLS